jgi:hypothetical protein
MARKKAAEPAAEDMAASEEQRPLMDGQRTTWAGLFLAAVALLAIGYAIGTAGADDTLVGSGTAAAQPAATVSSQAQVGRGLGQQVHAPGNGPALGRSAQAQGPAAGFGQGQGRGMGMVDGYGMGGGIGAGAGLGMGPGLGPDGSGTPGGGNITRVPGQGPYGQNFPGECPFGIYQPQDGVDAPVIDPGYLGVGVRQAPDGVVVVEVAADSPGLIAGIEVGDVIVSLDGVEVATVGQFARIVRFTGAGADVEIGIQRAGGEVMLTATLASIPN